MMFQWQIGILEAGDSDLRLNAHSALELNQRLQREFDRRAEPSDPRESLALASVDLALEHHRAVVKLFKIGESASAAAMLRVLIDCGFTATYILHFLTPEQAAEMSKYPRHYDDTRAYLPNTQKMHEKLASLDGVGHNINFIYKNQLKIFHKLTHGDIPQLVRRRTGRVSYNAEERQTLIELASLFLLAATYVGAQAVRSTSLKAQITELRNRATEAILLKAGEQMDQSQREAVPPDPLWQSESAESSAGPFA